MILARHAEALLWVGRYLERAETTARSLAVADGLIMHLQPADAAEEWIQLIRALGLTEEFEARGVEPTHDAVATFLIVGEASGGSVRAAISAVRENLRVARDRIPIELWEEANRLHLELRDLDLDAVLAEPYEALARVRRSCQAMSGVIGEAMGRDEGHAFIVIGRMLERSIVTVELLSAELARARGEFEADRLLRSVTALQAFRRAHGYDADWPTVSRFLLASAATPRSVLSAIRRLEDRLARFEGAGTLAEPRRLAGQLRSEIEFSDLATEVGSAPFDFLGDLHGALSALAESVQVHIVPPIGSPETHAQFVRPGRITT